MMDIKFPWFEEFPGAITFCDPQGVILAMNLKSAAVFQKEGGYELIGKNLLDCHPEPARSKLLKLLENKTPNIYTIQKDGKKKLLYQAPIFHEGNYEGFVELMLEIPEAIPHFNRDSSKDIQKI